MSIRMKLLATLAALSLTLVSLFVAANVAMGQMNARLGSVIADRVGPLEELKQVADGYAVSIVDNVHKVRSGRVSFADGAKVMADAEAVIAKNWSAYLATSLTDEEVLLVSEAKAAMDSAAPEMATLRSLVNENDAGALADFADHRLYPAIDPISNAVSKLVELQVRVARSEYDRSQLLYGQVNMMMLGLSILGLATVGFASFVIIRTVSRRLSGMEHALAAVANGNFDTVIPSAGDRDEIGRIATAAETFRRNGLKVAELTAQDAEQVAVRAAERRRMMADLLAAFGSVVDAAMAGDFSQRVTAHFPDEELNSLAGSVNGLVETVDRGLEETTGVLGAMAETDLTQRVAGTYRGAFDKLKRDVNAVADRLTEIVGRLSHTSGAVRTATMEILSGANDLAERTTRQAAAIEETSAAMEQLARTVTENAGRAQEASRNAESVSNTAAGVGQVMADANTAMERITASSERISSIIGLIDDVAFQTNLLALNASVEAARAGEAGKGFAVVAVEVRRLAQSAANASAEVKALIEQSSNEVGAGTRLVSNATDRLAAMVRGISANAELVESIAAASREQSSAISEVTTAVRQMDEMTQHNAALVEETNAAIEQTEAQAGELDRIVEVFVIDRDHARWAEDGRRDQRTIRRAAQREYPAMEGTSVAYSACPPRGSGA